VTYHNCTPSVTLADGERLYECAECWALVHETDITLHREWHVTLIAQLAALASPTYGYACSCPCAPRA
jgi:hypothetical protein